jgi:8-oxo-dGTP pyrophosphatase MutT (NUDIX family)
MTTIGAFAVLRDDDGRVLCVKQNYPPHEWTLPGGRVEAHESPIAALHREVLEESGYHIAIAGFLGAYARTHADDVVLVFTARILDRVAWTPNGEIAMLDFFAPNALPEPMNSRNRLRIGDAVEGRAGVVRVFGPTDSLLDSFPPL